MEHITEVVSLIIGAASLFYAIYTNRERKRSENIIRSQMAVIAGHANNLIQYANYAWIHFGEINDVAANMEEKDRREKILKASQLGTGDALAVWTNLTALLGYVKGIQQALFGTSDISYPSDKENG